MWHNEIVQLSIDRYQAQLQTIDAVNPALQRARASIVALNSSALQGRPLAGFGVGDLLPMQPSERLLLVNQASIGFGNPCGTGSNPGLLIVGTEHAYDPEKALHSLAVEGIALSAMWHADADSPQVAAIAGRPDWADVAAAFHRNPSAYYGQQSSGHTWSRAAACLFGHGDIARLFSTAYFFELSPHASPRAIGGYGVTAPRLEFLKQTFHACAQFDKTIDRPAVNTLWFHGNGRNATFEAARMLSMRSFFGLPTGALPAEQHPSADKSYFRLWEHGDRLAIHTRALSGASGATNLYWQAVRAVLMPRIGEAA